MAPIHQIKVVLCVYEGLVGSWNCGHVL